MSLFNRIVVAAVLLAGFFGLLRVGSPALWGVATAVVAALAAREWARLCGYSGAESLVFAGLFFPLAGVGWLVLGGSSGGSSAGREAYFAATAAFWAGLVPWWLAREWSPAMWVKGAVGMTILLAAWLAGLALFRQNVVVLAAALGVVWVADAAAYGVGKTLGESRLAPRLSPNKTWEGFIGGVGAVFVYALVLSGWSDAWSPPVALMLCAGFSAAALALAGDLFESLAKRQAGVKDSGRLLGGHGGALDRLDAALPVLPFAALVSPWL